MVTKEKTPFNPEGGLEIRRGIYVCHTHLALSSAENPDAKVGCPCIKAAWEARNWQA